MSIAIPQIPNYFLQSTKYCFWPDLVSVADCDWGIVDIVETAGQWGECRDRGAVQVLGDVVGEEPGGCQDTQQHDYTPQRPSFFPGIKRNQRLFLPFILSLKNVKDDFSLPPNILIAMKACVTTVWLPNTHHQLLNKPPVRLLVTHFVSWNHLGNEVVHSTYIVLEKLNGGIENRKPLGFSNAILFYLQL